MVKLKLPNLKNLDFTEPTTGTILILIILILFEMLISEYMNIPINLPIYMLVGGILLIFLIPVLFVKYYYMVLIKYCPERHLFINARKYKFPLVQEWNSNGFFTFKKADMEEIKKLNLPRSYTIRGLEIYQKIVGCNNLNVYKEAFQNVSTNYLTTDMQTFKQIIEILKRKNSDYMLKLIIICGISLFIVLVGLGVFLKIYK